jgi:hypothetical protein
MLFISKSPTDISSQSDGPPRRRSSAGRIVAALKIPLCVRECVDWAALRRCARVVFFVFEGENHKDEIHHLHKKDKAEPDKDDLIA